MYYVKHPLLFGAFSRGFGTTWFAVNARACTVKLCGLSVPALLTWMASSREHKGAVSLAACSKLRATTSLKLTLGVF